MPRARIKVILTLCATYRRLLTLGKAFNPRPANANAPRRAVSWRSDRVNRAAASAGDSPRDCVCDVVMHRGQLSSGTKQVVLLRSEFIKAWNHLADQLVFFSGTSEDLVLHDHQSTPAASTRSHSSFSERMRVKDDWSSG